VPLFEAAAPMARALWNERPFASYPQLVDRAEALAQAMSFEDQVAVLDAHPRIGESAATLSVLSYREQGHAAGSALDAGERDSVFARLAELNAVYEQRFGFRFVVFVNRRPKAEIVKVLDRRLTRSREAEVTTGLRELFAIARDRLCSLC
jgi:OHCU decarboxylase